MNGKVAKALLGVYAGAGVLTGIIFGKAMYHKGKADAYDDCSKKLTSVLEEAEEKFAKKDEAEEAE